MQKENCRKKNSVKQSIEDYNNESYETLHIYENHFHIYMLTTHCNLATV